MTCFAVPWGGDLQVGSQVEHIGASCSAAYRWKPAQEADVIRTARSLHGMPGDSRAGGCACETRKPHQLQVSHQGTCKAQHADAPSCRQSMKTAQPTTTHRRLITAQVDVCMFRASGASTEMHLSGQRPARPALPVARHRGPACPPAPTTTPSPGIPKKPCPEVTKVWPIQCNQAPLSYCVQSWRAQAGTVSRSAARRAPRRPAVDPPPPPFPKTHIHTNQHPFSMRPVLDQSYIVPG